jgi:hypothetical protein
VVVEGSGLGDQFRGLSGKWAEIFVRISERGSFFLDLGLDWGRILLRWCGRRGGTQLFESSLVNSFAQSFDGVIIYCDLH